MTILSRREHAWIEAECRRRLRWPPPWPHGSPALTKIEHKPAHVAVMHKAVREIRKSQAVARELEK